MGAAGSSVMAGLPVADAMQLGAALARHAKGSAPAFVLQELMRSKLDHLPLPACGKTLARWQALAAVAEHDLSLAKLYEGHLDALAILQELQASCVPTSNAGGPSVWGVWAAESPGGRVHIDPGPADGGKCVRLHGTKHWCSGAATVSHALLTAWPPNSTQPKLVLVAMDQPGIYIHGDAWKAVGMQASSSLQVHFDGAVAQLVGSAGAYLSRPGFWQGGAGIAACWYGGACGIASALHRAVAEAPAGAASNVFRLAALGRVDTQLRSTAALLVQTAAWIDANPQQDASAPALRARLAAARCATDVLEASTAALGAGALCLDAAFAQAAADLPVFIRQSHADRDYAALGEKLGQLAAADWAL